MPPEEKAWSTEEVFAVVYPELKRLARRHLHALEAHPTLCTTELVHEAFLKLRPGTTWQDRAHFFGAAARAMRQILVDLARRRQSAKRGGGQRALSLTEADAALDLELDQILDLHASLTRLEAVDARLAQIVELRFFAGRSESEIAELLGLSARTVERDWLKARLFLLSEVKHE